MEKNNKNAWSENDEKLLADNYGFRPYTWIQERLEKPRSAKAIGARVRALGLKKKVHVFTKEEDEIINEHFEEKGAKYCAFKILNDLEIVRAESSIISRARQHFGLKRDQREINRLKSKAIKENKGKKFSDDDLLIIQKYFNTVPVDVISDMLSSPRSNESIYQATRRVHLDHPVKEFKDPKFDKVYGPKPQTKSSKKR